MTLVITGFYTVALVGFFASMNQSFYVQTQTGELQTSGRLVLDTVIASLRGASFGIPPAAPAIDVAPTGGNCLGSSCPSGAGWSSGCMSQDNVAGLYGSDEIVFLARDPVVLQTAFGGGTSVGFPSPATPFQTSSSFLLALAPNVASTLFFTKTSCASGCGSVTVAGVTGCPYAPANLGTITPSEVDVVRMVHFYIDWSDVNHPVLMQGSGLVDPLSSPMQEFARPIASNVEDLQIAYHVLDAGQSPTFYAWMNATAPGGSCGANTLCSRIAALGAARVLATVDAIRVSVVVRSDSPDPNLKGAQMACLCSENSGCCTSNQTVSPAPTPTLGPLTQYTRQLFQVVVPTPNFGSFNPYFSNSIL